MVYKIRMKKDDYFKINNKIISSNLAINGDDVEFEIEGGSYNILKRTSYEYKVIESLQTKILRFFSHYGLVVTGILFLLSVLYMNIYRVSRIEFNRTTPINDEIEYRIRSSFRTLFCFQFCNLDYEDFSKNMRKKYFEYPYINVTRKNNVISVYIAPIDEANQVISDGIDGNIVAKKDGIVDVFYTYTGKAMVTKNQYVKAGDVLIEGNQKASGLVMATTYEKIELTIPKKNMENVITTERHHFYNLKLFNFNFDIAKKKNYELYDTEERLIFNLFDFFSLKKIEQTQKNAIMKTYQEEEAYAMAVSRIESDFKEHQKNDLEKILAMIKTKVDETDENYTFTLILKKYESIGVSVSRE